MSRLASLADFRASKYNDPTWTDEQVQEALDYAEARFLRLTNRDRTGMWFVPRELTVFVHGTGSECVRVPYPVLSLSQVVVIEENGLTTEITQDVRYHGRFLWYDGTFPRGFKNVQIVGTFGDPRYGGTVPEDVKEAILRFAWLKLRRSRLAGERVTDFRPPPSDGNVPPPTYTGDRELDGIIKSYIVDDITGGFDFR